MCLLLIIQRIEPPCRSALCAEGLPHVRNLIKSCTYLQLARIHILPLWPHLLTTAFFQDDATPYHPFFTAFFLTFYRQGFTSGGDSPECYLEKQPTAWSWADGDIGITLLLQPFQPGPHWKAASPAQLLRVSSKGGIGLTCIRLHVSYAEFSALLHYPYNCWHFLHQAKLLFSLPLPSFPSLLWSGFQGTFHAIQFLGNFQCLIPLSWRLSLTPSHDLMKSWFPSCCSGCFSLLLRPVPPLKLKWFCPGPACNYGQRNADKYLPELPCLVEEPRPHCSSVWEKALEG